MSSPKSKKPVARPKRSQSLAPLWLVLGLIIVIAGGAVLSQTLGRAPSGASTSPTVAGSVPYPNVARLSPAEVQTLLEQGRATLYDVRSQTAYETLHAAGAIHFPSTEVAARVGELPAEGMLIFYCT